MRRLRPAHSAGPPVREALTIASRAWEEVHTGIVLMIPTGYYGQISSRSGLAFHQKVTAFPGVIDSDYRGEIKVLLQNWSSAPVEVQCGDRVAQILLIPLHNSDRLLEVGCVEPTVRGENGYGSTGK